MSNNILARNELIHRGYRFGNYPYFQKKNTLSKIHQDEICEYLVNPVKYGLWFLKFKWHVDGKLVDDLVLENKNLFDKTKANKNRYDMANFDLKKEISKVYFTFELFNTICNQEDGAVDREQTNLLVSYRHTLVEQLKLVNFKEKYKDAIHFFKENIYCPNWSLRIVPGEIITIKDGYFISRTIGDEIRLGKVDNRDDIINRKIEFLSTDLSSLKKISDFFILIEKIDISSKIYRVFSPEEDLFYPYAIFLSDQCKYAIQDKALIDRFEKSLNEYDDDDYPHSIGTIGLAAEDILSQVFETLFREWVPKQYTLGQILDGIDTKVNNLYKEQQDEEPDVSYLYETTKFLIKKGEKVTKREILELNRELINCFSGISKHQKNKIDNILKKDNVKSIFPSDLKENVIELIRYRNSISHISRNPIGKYEATRSIFTCFRLYKWWINTIQNIDWAKTQEDIVKSLVRE